MKFKSKKEILFSILILGSAAFLAGFSIFGVVFGWIEQTDYWILVPFAAITALLLWIYFGTGYLLTDTELIYYSGPIRGKIRLDQIREIEKGKTMYAGLKPATARKGLIIKFRTYDEIYISPDSNEEFIAHIRKLNPAIRVSG